jgi:hypothetical protein
LRIYDHIVLWIKFLWVNIPAMPRLTLQTDRIHFKAMRAGTPDHIRQVILQHIRNPELPGTSEIFDHFMTAKPKEIQNTTYFRGRIIYPTRIKQKHYKIKHKY